MRREPDRARVVAGEPATVGELRRRYGAPGRGTRASPRSSPARPRSRSNGPSAGCVGDRYKVPRLIAEAIEDSPEYRREVAELAARLELPEEEVARRAAADLAGLVASMSPMAVDLFTGALRPLHARAWNVQVDEAGLARLRERNRSHPLVFLPSHRSYADPLLLADVLAEHDFPRNHVLGGDNLRFWPVGPLAKRAGVVFIRRSFGDDEVYKLAVREYFGYLLAKRFNLEWYMEGGRSRTGKLRPPRYGLLANVAEAIEQGRADDVYLVPVSITYDQLREVVGDGRRAGRGAEEGRGAGVARPLRPRPARAARLGLRAVRRADLAARRARAGRARPAAARCRRWRSRSASGSTGSTPVVATALVTLALLGVRDRALTLAAGAAGARPGARLPGGARAGRGGRRRCPPTPGCGGCSARWSGRKVVHDLRGRRGAGVRDRARPAPRRGVLPQLRDPPLRRPGDRRAGAARRARGPLGRRARPCATC